MSKFGNMTTNTPNTGFGSGAGGDDLDPGSCKSVIMNQTWIGEYTVKAKNMTPGEETSNWVVNIGMETSTLGIILTLLVLAVPITFMVVLVVGLSATGLPCFGNTRKERK